MITINIENAKGNVVSGKKPVPRETIATIKSAKVGKSTAGAVRLELELDLALPDSNLTESTRYDIYTHGAEGKEIFTKKFVDKIAVCLGINDLGVNGFNEAINLNGKKIGLFLNTKDQEYKGNISTKYELLEVYQAQTRLLSSEVLSGSVKPKLFDVFLSKIRHIELKLDKVDSDNKLSTVGSSKEDSTTAAFSDDDIPF